jgi:lysocardiolipin and lysophospholipid acyltransferase
MQLHHFIFINKKWIDDKEYIADSLRYLSETGPPVHLQVFPEGTILSKANKEQSHEYSEKNGLQKFDYVLNPRIKGFVQMVSTLRETGEVDVYDFTTGYVGKYDITTLFGTLPKEVHYHVKHYPSSSLPSSDEGLSDWLKERWVEKEERLANFYQSHSFPGPIFQDGWKTKALMIAVFIKWLVLYALMMFSLIQVPLVTIGILGVSSAIHYIVDKWMDGWDKVAIRKWKRKSQ